MTDFVCKDAFVLINPYKQLNILNELFSEYELENYSFNPFVLTQNIVNSNSTIAIQSNY